ncbi:MAG: hypothetical protein ABSG25_02165 [Bryobacteraceae bacterium]|jgi:cell division septum initiation protein DivIVA
MTENIDFVKILVGLKSAIEKLAQERDSLSSRIAEIDRQIAGLRQSANGLKMYAQAQEKGNPFYESVIRQAEALLENQPDTQIPPSLTEACRKILRAYQRPMTARDMRDHLENIDFDFSGYRSNPLSSIHTTLNRLKDSGQVEEVNQPGGRAYRWRETQ